MKNHLCDPGEAVSRADKVWLILRAFVLLPVDTRRCFDLPVSDDGSISRLPKRGNGQQH